MELEEEDAIYRELRDFRQPQEFYTHPSNALVYTPGVKYLAGRSGLHWFIDFIAGWQPRALLDPWLAEFQLWELAVSGKRCIVSCSRDSENVAFHLGIAHRDSLLRYVSLYLQGGVLMLPSEH